MGIPAKSDVLVIGGGPARGCAATRLARLGYGVVLVDKVSHPRETVGESILPSAWKYFDRLGVTERVEREGFVKKAGGVVDWENEVTQISFRDFDYDRPGLHVERAGLDHFVLGNWAGPACRCARTSGRKVSSRTASRTPRSRSSMVPTKRPARSAAAS